MNAGGRSSLRRDPKGLYARADAGAVNAFTGRDSAFEKPERADLVLDTERETPEQCLEKLHALVRARIDRAPASPST